MYCLCGLLYKHLKQFFPRYHPERKHQITVFLSLLSPSEWKVTGSLLESLIAKRNEYSKNCNKTLVASALSITGKPSASLHICHFFITFTKSSSIIFIAGNYCKGAFDMFVCWPHSSPGNVSVPCPSFLPWISDGNVVLSETNHRSAQIFKNCIMHTLFISHKNAAKSIRILQCI